MEIIDVMVLAVVQGLTEFIPVSSSGHLLVARWLFGISDIDGTAFDAFLHLGTLAAVLLYYWRVWAGIARSVIRNDAEGQDKRELLAKLAVATVPAAVIGYFFQDEVSEALRAPAVLIGTLLFTAAVLWWFDGGRLRRQRDESFTAGGGGRVDRATFRDATYIGLAQVLALLPGVSRSGMTIAAGRGRGLSRRQAATFSFLLSAPIIAGAGLASLPSLLSSHGFTAGQLVIGFGLSFISGLLAIAGLLKLVERISFTPFVVYLVLLAGMVAVYAQ